MQKFQIWRATLIILAAQPKAAVPGGDSWVSPALWWHRYTFKLPGDNTSSEARLAQRLRRGGDSPCPWLLARGRKAAVHPRQRPRLARPAPLTQLQPNLPRFAPPAPPIRGPGPPTQPRALHPPRARPAPPAPARPALPPLRPPCPSPTHPYRPNSWVI